MIDINFRTCPTCGNTKPIDDYKISKISGARHLQCWSCVSEYTKTRYITERVTSRCPQCGISVPILRFYDEYGKRHNHCLACRVVGPGEPKEEWNQACDERAEKYIAELEKVVESKKNMRRSMYDH